jgi:hypothetical protein
VVANSGYSRAWLVFSCPIVYEYIIATTIIVTIILRMKHDVKGVFTSVSDKSEYSRPQTDEFYRWPGWIMKGSVKFET